MGVAAAEERPRVTRRAYRWNLVLSAVLLLAALAFANALAKHRAVLRLDLTADGLTSFDPALLGLFERLEDVLVIEAFFTGAVEHGPVQVAKQRLVEQLRSLEARAGGRLRVRYRDPNASTEVRLEATRLGIEPVPVQATQGAADVRQELFLGVALRYRGRQRVLPFVLPQTFEYLLATELERLLRTELPRIGFVDRDVSMGSKGAPGVGFDQARALLAADFDVVPVRGLADGASVQAAAGDLDALVLARPIELHPRAAFAIDAYVQAGGRLLVLADRVEVTDGGEVRERGSGLEACLAAWGAATTTGQVWDQNCNAVTQTRQVTVDGRRETVPAGQVRYPYWVRVEVGGLAESVPVTGTLSGADLFWAHALEPHAPPAGVTAVELLKSSERAWIVEPVADVAVDATYLNARAAELLATGGGARRTLARSLRGVLPSGFAGRPVPLPRDPVDDARWRRKRDAALAAGEPVPAYPAAEAAPGAPEGRRERGAGSQPAHVIVVGDADWIESGPTFTDRNKMLLRGLIGWLALGEELVTLRARVPKERRIADFNAEERERLGLGAVLGTESWDEAQRVSRLEAQARSAAGTRRWMHMLATTGGALALLALGFAVTRWRTGASEGA